VFHQACTARRAAFPDAMLATATHDHKRGEDLRARLAVLSEIPGEWGAFIARIRALPCPVDRPDPGDEIMLHQMIVGAWPLDLHPSDDEGCRTFATRLAGWQEKALREAKLRTDWTAPDEAYESVARDFLFHVFSPGSQFLSLAHSFAELIAPAGAVNGLVQAALKMTVPGLPDFYQGTEFWDFSLVDPDNRRAVDYGARRSALANEHAPAAVLPSWRDGHVKQWMIRAILRLRSVVPELFSRGDYGPLEVKGPARDRVVAFTRNDARSALVVVAPRLVHRLPRTGDGLLFHPTALSGSIVMPTHLHGRRMHSLLAGGESVDMAAERPVAALLADFPVAVLYSADFA
jgi:(1->4)-alpha-D-glucan 1-alpha-D-glucosylmutase